MVESENAEFESVDDRQCNIMSAKTNRNKFWQNNTHQVVELSGTKQKSISFNTKMVSLSPI
jgi:hypothetical protein